MHTFKCINKSISFELNFAGALKIAIVKPLFKNSEKNCLNYCGLISLLHTLSKTFERVIYCQLYNYFNKIILLAEQQYEFRPQHYTALETIKLIDSKSS